MSKIPILLERMDKENLDKEILRAGMIAELYAVNLYGQMEAMAENPCRRFSSFAVNER